MGTTKYGYIYKTVNLIDNKIYVGQKKSDKFLGNKYLGSGKYLKSAINKYGKENFNVEIIEWCANKEELNKREIYWICYYRKIDELVMYNISAGGDGGDTYYNLSAEDRKRRCKLISRVGYFTTCSDVDRSVNCKKAWNTRRRLGKDVFTDKHKKALSFAHKGIKRSPDSIQKGILTKMCRKYHHTTETKLKISKSNKGKKHSISADVRCRMSLSSKVRNSGCNNPFYNKKHTDNNKQLISKCSKNNWDTNHYKWVHMGSNSYRIPEKDLEKYINSGYCKGRGKLKNE